MIVSEAEASRILSTYYPPTLVSFPQANNSHLSVNCLAQSIVNPCVKLVLCFSAKLNRRKRLAVHRDSTHPDNSQMVRSLLVALHVGVKSEQFMCAVEIEIGLRKVLWRNRHVSNTLFVPRGVGGSTQVSGTSSLSVDLRQV